MFTWMVSKSPDWDTTLCVRNAARSAWFSSPLTCSIRARPCKTLPTLSRLRVLERRNARSAPTNYSRLLALQDAVIPTPHSFQADSSSALVLRGRSRLNRKSFCVMSPLPPSTRRRPAKFWLCYSKFATRWA